MLTGIVKWFDAEKGYGFLAPEKGDKDVFVHHSAIQMEGYRKLAEGQQVEYELGSGRDGREQAVRVWPVEEKR